MANERKRRKIHCWYSWVGIMRSREVNWDQIMKGCRSQMKVFDFKNMCMYVAFSLSSNTIPHDPPCPAIFFLAGLQLFSVFFFFHFYWYIIDMYPKSLQLCPILCDPMEEPARLLCPWNFLGKNARLGGHFLLQGIFQTQGLIEPCLLCLLHWQVGSLPLVLPTALYKFKMYSITIWFNISWNDYYLSLVNIHHLI